MRRIGLLAMIGFVGIALMPRAAAQAEGVFEWYFAGRFGLEGSLAFAADTDVETDGEVLAGRFIKP